jgi:hypothetical protein
MASATGIPERTGAREEDEPLLGRPGDVTQHSGQGLQMNFVTGTGKHLSTIAQHTLDETNHPPAILAQAGILILTALVWAAIFTNEVIFFSYHPLLNSAALLLLVQGLLVLQPTSHHKDKITGTYVHSSLNTVGVALLIAGLIVIEMNKASHPETRFQSVHGKMGLVVYIVIGIQWVVGVAMFYGQNVVFKDVDQAKGLYKYHRCVE